MYYVYQLQSVNDPEQRYTGYTTSIESRLSEHNNGQVSHTSKFKPWKLKNYFVFTNETTAKNFETYLKSGSGRAFSKKHFQQ